MGQKVNPHSIRLGITRTWGSSWYAPKATFAQFLHDDIQIKTLVKTILKNCGVSKVEIERSLQSIVVNVFSAKPGMIIGKKGDNIDKLKLALQSKFNKTFTINIKEIKKPELDAELVAASIAQQIEKRIPYRRAVKAAIEKSMEAGSIGIKIKAGGRLNGAEIARKEFFKQGNIPLHTFRADIDFAHVAAHTTYGAIGIKVWIYKGEKFKKKAVTVSNDAQ